VGMTIPSELHLRRPGKEDAIQAYDTAKL